MLSASKIRAILFIIVSVFVFEFILTSRVFAATAGYQKCSVDSTCQIGEYLYNDDYSVNNSATCTLTSHYPDGSTFLNSQAMTVAAQNDGWYSYSFSTNGFIQGVYRSQMTCVVSGETTRLDKTFIVDSTNLSSTDVENAVWNATASGHNVTGSFGSNLQNPAASIAGIWSYPERTLTSFGTLVFDIWHYTTRSLNDFGTLIADIWTNATRTLTSSDLASGGQLATKANVDSATTSATTSIKGASNKDLTQVSTDVAGVSTKVDAIDVKINTLSTNVDTINTNTSSILSKWGSYSASDIIGYVDTLETNLGSTSDTCLTSTIYGGIRCIRDKWGSQTADAIFTAANNASTYSAALRNELDYNGKSSTAYQDIQAIKIYTASINSGMLSSTDVENAVWNATASGHNVTGSFGSNLQNPAASIAGIWSYPERTLTSFGTLVFDIWHYTTRSLNDFGTLIADIWTNATRTLTSSDLASGGQLATKANVDSATTSATTSIKGASNKDLTQVSTDVAGVSTKVDSVITKVDTLSSDVGTLNTNVNTILSKWGSSSVSDILNAISGISGGSSPILGTTSDTCSDTTIYGQIKCVQDKWGSKTADDLYTAANDASTTVTSLRAELNYNGKSTNAYQDLQTLKTDVGTLQTLVGSTSDTSSTASLYGRIQKVQETVQSLNVSNADVSDLLAKWGTYTASDIYNKISDISSNVSGNNSVSGVSDILSLVKTNSADIQSLKNTALSIQAIVEINKEILENGTTKPIIQTWLEEGSVIFKTLITNPSPVTQTIPVKFYLPKEATDKDIIKMDSGLTVGYDPSSDAYYISGQVTLPPNGTQIFSVEVTDIWKITPEEISSLRIQAKELYDPLKGTSYYAQGATLYADIVAALDTADAIQKQAQTPESRIKAYRDAKVQTDKAKTEIDNLKTLGASTSNNGNLLGFVGGIQTVAVWGMVLVFVVGFVFMTLYIRMIMKLPRKERAPKGGMDNFINVYIEGFANLFRKINKKYVFGVFACILAILILGSIIKFIVPKINTIKNVQTNNAKVALVEKTETKSNKIFVKVIDEQSQPTVNVRSGAGTQFEKIGEIIKGKNYEEIGKTKDKSNQTWEEIKLDSVKSGWVLAEYVQVVNDNSEISSNNEVNIKNPNSVLGVSTNINELTIIASSSGVNLREGPSTFTKIIKRITVNTKAKKIGESNDWLRVLVNANNNNGVELKGWIKKDYVQ